MLNRQEGLYQKVMVGAGWGYRIKFSEPITTFAGAAPLWQNDTNKQSRLKKNVLFEPVLSIVRMLFLIPDIHTLCGQTSHIISNHRPTLCKCLPSPVIASV